MKFPCFWFEPTPQGKFMLQIAFGQSKYYIDNLSENVKRGLRQKIRQGEMVGIAPTGYLNDLATHKMVLDPERAPLIRKLFETYGTGNFNLKEVMKLAETWGLRSRKGKVLALSNIQSILKKPFYYGLICLNSEFFEGSHTPVISKKLFDKVQEIMKKKGKPRKVKSHNFPFLGFMKCLCGCAITAEKKIKKSGRTYIYYRCTKKKGPCLEKHFLREKNLLEQINSFLQKVSLSSQDTEKVLTELEKDENLTKEQAKTTVQNLKLEILELEQKLDKLLDLCLNGQLDKDEYALKKEKFLNSKVGFQEQIRDFEQKGLSWLEPAREFVLSLNKAEKILKSEDRSEMTSFLKNIGSNHLLQNRQLIFKPNSPYDLIADPPSGGEADLTFPEWRGHQDLNLEIFFWREAVYH